MTALASITAVRPTLGTKTSLVAYGATISAGQSVYLDATDGLHKLADSNVSAATAKAVGIAMTPGVNGGYGIIATEGNIILVGTTMAVGQTHFVGPTAGSIDDASASGDYVTVIGTAATSTQLNLAIKATGVLKA